MSFLSDMAGGVVNNALSSFLGGGGKSQDATVSIGSVTLPVPPQSFEVQVKQKNETLAINNLGDINMIGKTGLKQVSISSFFPAQQYSFCVSTAGDPYQQIETLNNLRTAGKPTKVSITGTNLSMDCTVDDLSWGEKDGSGDVYFSVTLREYVYVVGNKDTTIQAKTGLMKRKPSFMENVAKNISYRPGDSLMDVASRAVGKSLPIGNKEAKYLQLYKKVAKHGIKPGDVLAMSGSDIKINGKKIDLSGLVMH